MRATFAVAAILIFIALAIALATAFPRKIDRPAA
jgi:hypothetical protein